MLRFSQRIWRWPINLEFSLIFCRQSPIDKQSEEEADDINMEKNPAYGDLNVKGRDFPYACPIIIRL